MRILLLDDEPVTLVTRALILRKHGYECLPASTYEEAVALFADIDIAVLDYHLGTGKFGSDVAIQLRNTRPSAPIIILSATLDHSFGGAEDIHLLKGYSSNEHLLDALRSLEAKRQGSPIVADAAKFFYSRIAHALGPNVLVQIFDAQGTWLFCNEEAAEYLGHERNWFPGRRLDQDLSPELHHWQQVISDVATRQETYIDRTRHGLIHTPELSPDGPGDRAWSIIAAPIALPSGHPGVLLTARALMPG